MKLMPKARWLGRVRLGWVMVALLAVAVLFGPPARQRLDPVFVKQGNARLPSGYTEIVRRLIEARGEPLIEVVADPRGSDDDDGLVAGKVQLTSAGAEFPYLRGFVDRSYLRDDMESLASTTWRTDGTGTRLLGVFGSAHLLRGPYDQGESWTGNILFSNNRDPRQLVMLGDRPIAELASALGGREVPEPLFDDAAKRGSALASVLKFTLGNETVGFLQRVGNRLMLRVPASNEVEVRIDGKALVPGLEGVARRELPFGSALSFFDKRKRVATTYVVRQQLETVSRAIAGRGRERDPVLASISRPLEAAMASGKGDVPLTIDSDVQAAAQRQLTAVGHRVLNHQPVSFRAAATLIDGTTGKVRALATYPAAPADLVPSERELPQRLQLLDQNQNFVPLPIGSTAKVPFAAAILKARPELLSLVVPGLVKYRTLLGFDLGGNFTDHSAATMNFEHFIAYSSNRYASTLMLLGLQWNGDGLANPDRGAMAWYRSSGATTDRYTVNGQEYQYPPSFRVLANARWGEFGARVSRDNQSRDVWTSNLGDLFGLGYFGAGSESLRAGDATNNPLWRGIDPARPWLLLPAVAERETFGFDRVNDIGSDYVMSILGGNRSRWSTVRLAEAYSRIVANNLVRARLVESQDAEHFGQLPLDPAIRAALLGGMRGVFVYGTGDKLVQDPSYPAALRDGVANGSLWLMGKTGTPNVVRESQATAESLLLNDFAKQADPSCNVHLTRNRRLAIGSGDAVSTIERCAPYYRDRARLLAEEVDRVNDDPIRRRQLGVTAGLVRSVPIAPERTISEFGKVMVLSVARVERLPNRAPRFCTTRTIAINFQARVGEKDEPARMTALRMLNEPAILNWLIAPCPRAEAA